MDKMDDYRGTPKGGVVQGKNKTSKYGRGYHAEQYEKFQSQNINKPKTNISVLHLPHKEEDSTITIENFQKQQQLYQKQF